MKFLKKMLQVVLAVFFFGLLATSVVLADDADSEGWQFVQENSRLVSLLDYHIVPHDVCWYL